MHVFFGRIALDQQPHNQFKDGVYHAQKGMNYFAEINQFENFESESVYVFMLAGKTVELWKAIRWGEGGQDLFFSKPRINLDDMNRARLAAFKFFKLDSDLIVFTVRRPYQKAFFKLTVDESFTEDMLLNPNTYSDFDNYRKVEFHEAEPAEITRNLIFYKHNNEWRFKKGDFIDDLLSDSFRDNMNYLGKGRVKKDNSLRLIQNIVSFPAVFNPHQFTLIRIYDAFFCDYNEQIDNEIILEASQNLYKISMSPKDISEDAFNYLIDGNQIMVHKDTLAKGVAHVTQGEIFVNKIKTDDYFYLCRGNEKFILVGKIEGDAVPCTYKDLGSRGWVQRKFNLIKNARVEDSFEGGNKWWTPNNNSTCILIKDIEIELANKLIFVDYFDLRFKKINSKTIQEPITIDTKFLSMNLNTILYGPPGTGKTYHTIIKAAEIIAGQDFTGKYGEAKELYRKSVNDGEVSFVTFHQNYSYEDFMAGLRPDVDSDATSIKFKEHRGVFFRLCETAKNNWTNYNSYKTGEQYQSDDSISREVILKNYVLVIDEINRANISRVFGELITLLEPDKRLGAENELRLRLPGLPNGELFGVPPNLYIVGTMNTADKSIALIDIALRRRFVFEDMYPTQKIIEDTVPSEFQEFLIELNNLIIEKKGPDFTIGHAYFIATAEAPLDIIQVLNNKVIPLLNEYFYNQRSKVVWDLLSKVSGHLKGVEFKENIFIGVKAKKIG